MDTEKSFYDIDGIMGYRYIILSDMEQEIPNGPLKVKACEMREAAGGKKYPVLRLEDEDGNEFILSAWKRDVRRCIQEWGGNPLSWGYITLKRGATRIDIFPSEPQPVKVEDIEEAKP